MLAQNLCCPHCQSPLKLENKTLSCSKNHCFDRAKQGYFNLLLSNQKKSKQPGDNVEMVIARQKFLDSGIYSPISSALNSTCVNVLDSQNLTNPPTVLDIGCGEGYYTERLEQHLKSRHPEIIGLDISKDAVRYASKRSKEITWIVASGSHPPVQEHSQNLITCLFTRLMPEGMAKSLNPEGRLITVTTGKHHLMEMREILYPQVKEQVMHPEQHLSTHFSLVQDHVVSYSHELQSSQQVSDLLAMTPHQWRAPEEGRNKLLSLDSLTITIDVNIKVFKLKQTINSTDL